MLRVRFFRPEMKLIAVPLHLLGVFLLTGAGFHWRLGHLADARSTLILAVCCFIVGISAGLSGRRLGR